MESSQDWTDRRVATINDLLDMTLSKLGMILKIFLDDPNQTVEDSDSMLEVHSLCYNMACSVSGWFEKKFPTIIPWLPEDRSLLENMNLLRSKSPWSFVLTYPHSNLDLMRNVSIEALPKYVVTPKTGTFICCSYRKRLFRGLLLDVLSYNRLKVLNIDTDEVFMVSNTDLYHLPEDVCTTHALFLHCSLLEDDIVAQGLWCEDLESIFVRTLRECSLKVEILRCCSGTPPKYLVSLVGSNKEGQSVNLSDWLHKKLIPDMKKNVPLLSSKDELFYFLEDQSIEPYWGIQHSSNTELSVVRVSQQIEHILSSLCSVPGIQEKLSPTSNYSQYSQSIIFEDQYKPLIVDSKPSQSCNVAKSTVSVPCSCRVSPSTSPVPERQVTKPLPCLRVVNKICLPNVGERVNLIITHVSTSLSFYVVLEEKYSNVITNGVVESYTTLMDRLNNPESSAVYKELPSSPSVGQLVSFRRTRSQIWSRGVVTEVGSSKLTVLNPDLGQSETVCPTDLRTILPEDTVLPFQAVLTFLHNIYIADNEVATAKDRFTNLTLLKKLYGIIKKVDQINSTMAVELFLSDDVNVNEVLVSSGVCKKVKNSH